MEVPWYIPKNITIGYARKEKERLKTCHSLSSVTPKGVNNAGLVFGGNVLPSSK